MLRVTDGAIIVVEPSSGFLNGTSNLVQRVMQQRNVPILLINKMDKVLFDQKLDPETGNCQLTNTIDKVRDAIEIHPFYEKESIPISPQNCNVIFGSSKDGWGFTLGHFADTYSAKTGIKREKFLEKLWGENYFDKVDKKWYTDNKNSQGAPLMRSFNQYVLQPIVKLWQTVHSEQQFGNQT